MGPGSGGQGWGSRNCGIRSPMHSRRSESWAEAGRAALVLKGIEAKIQVRDAKERERLGRRVTGPRSSSPLVAAHPAFSLSPPSCLLTSFLVLRTEKLGSSRCFPFTPLTLLPHSRRVTPNVRGFSPRPAILCNPSSASYNSTQFEE